MADKQEEQTKRLMDESFIRDYLEDEGITDISYNGTDLWLQHNRKGRYLAPIQPSIEEVEYFIRRVADIQGKGFTDTEPVLDTQIDFLRVNAIHVAVSPFGMTTALRVSRPRKAMNSLADICNEETEILLSLLIQADTSMVISGITGSGKTEVQKMLVGYIANNKKISLIEDTMDSHIKMLYREKDINSWRILVSDDRERKITFPILIKAGLRNNPDWMIISEVRDSGEARLMVEATLTGHSMLTTLHTTGAAATPNRLVDMIGETYSINEILYGKNIVQSIPLGIHMEQGVNEKGEIYRYIREIVEFIDFNEQGIVANPVYQVKNTYLGGDEYKTEKFMSPLSEKTQTHLQNKKLFHLLPDVFKRDWRVNLQDVKAI